MRIIPWRRRNAGTINRLAMHPSTGVRLAHTLDGVHLNIGPETLRLEGQYQVSINLTSEDVLRLFLKTFPELALGFRDLIGCALRSAIRKRGRIRSPATLN